MPEVVDLRCKLWATLHANPNRPAYCKIGRWFKRDHTSVIYGVKRHLRGEDDPMVAKKQAGHRALAAQKREERRERLKAAIQAWDASKWEDSNES
jgi:hypothetical protein